MCFNIVDYATKVRVIHHDCDVPVVFSRGAHHGGPTNIDILNRVRERAIWLGNGSLKWIEINHNQIDRCDVVAMHRVFISTAST